MNPIPPPERLGLRERKKRATRQALHGAALKLATDQGVDVTVDAICAEADVSARTFFNYFSSKEEAIIGDAPAVPSDDLLRDFEQGGPSGDLFADVRGLIAEHLEATIPSPQEMRLRHAILTEHPELAARFMGQFVAIERRLALAAARRSGSDPEDLHPQLVAAVATAAMRLSVRRWKHEGRTDLVDHVHTVFDGLRDTFDADGT